jgi:pimeloyl-ACP methyl ester carboxylesterase
VSGAAPFLSFADADEVFELDMDDGARLPVYRLAGPTGAGTLLFGHANGLAAGSYAPWFKMLARHVSVFAYDARGHGGSRWPEGPLDRVFSVDRMAEDLARVADAVASRGDCGRLSYAGHSLGGASGMRLAATGRTGLFHALMIFEPPIFPLPGAPEFAETRERQDRLIAGTLKRRTHWPSPDAFRARLEGRGMFARFDRAMLDAHCRATLRPVSEGGYRLCCPPEIESVIFAAQPQSGSWALLPGITRLVDLVGGDPDVPGNDWISAMMPQMAASMPNARLTRVPRAGHLLISEQPQECAEIVLAHLQD